MGEFRNRQSAEILCSVYKNAQMAYEASNDVLRHCRSSELYNEISAQRDKYRQVAAAAKNELSRRGQKARQYPPAAKAMARMGIAMKLLNNHSGRNIASIMIRGTTMGIIDMQHAVNRSGAAEPRIRDDAQRLLDREQDYCERLRRYL